MYTSFIKVDHHWLEVSWNLFWAAKGGFGSRKVAVFAASAPKVITHPFKLVFHTCFTILFSIVLDYFGLVLNLNKL